jgi:hypothetical protein
MGLPDLKSYEPKSVRIARLMGLADAEGMSETALAKLIGQGIPVTLRHPVAPSERFTIGSLINPMASNRHPATDFGNFNDRISKAITKLAANFPGDDDQLPEVLSREASERLYEVSRVYDTAPRAFGGNAEKADAFLNRAHPLLDGEVPL